MMLKDRENVVMARAPRYEEYNEDNEEATREGCDDDDENCDFDYEYETNIDMRSDGNREFLQLNNDGTFVDNFTKIICGMLNAGREGWVILGIDNRNGFVKGVSLDRLEADALRLSIDSIMVHKIEPAVLHNQYKIYLRPVIRFIGSGETKKKVKCYKLYIVEVQIEPVLGIVYNCKFNNNEQYSYIRTGNKTVKISLENVRKIVFEYERERQLESSENILSLIQKLDDKLVILKSMMSPKV